MVLHIQVDPNYYIATLRSSTDMIDFKTITRDNGVQIRIAKFTDGSLKVQSILFPKEKYSSSSANITANLLETFWI